MKEDSNFRLSITAKSKSVDFSELFTSHQTPKTNQNKGFEQTQKQNDIKNKKTGNQDSFPEQGNEDGVGEIFGVILSRDRSVSSAAPPFIGLSAERNKLEFQEVHQSTKKRGFSLKKSASVSQGYCRICHQFDPVDDKEVLTSLRTGSKKKRGKILKACWRLFGF